MRRVSFGSASNDSGGSLVRASRKITCDREEESRIVKLIYSVANVATSVRLPATVRPVQ